MDYFEDAGHYTGPGLDTALFAEDLPLFTGIDVFYSNFAHHAISPT